VERFVSLHVLGGPRDRGGPIIMAICGSLKLRRESYRIHATSGAKVLIVIAIDLL